MRALITYAILVTIIEAAIIYSAFTRCLPDTEYRFFMGHGTQGQCLYMDMNSREVYEK